MDLRRTIASHGTASLPPNLLDEEAWTLETTIRVPGGRPRRIIIGEEGPGRAAVRLIGRTPGARQAETILGTVRHMLALDLDLSSFYALAAEDPDLAWVVRGAGRMVRASSVFEDVVKTICTTNCSWSLTTTMVTALVTHLGEPAAGAPADGWRGRTFPAPEAMARAGEGFLREVVRAGYRAPHLVALSRSVADGRIDLEPLVRATREELPDEEVEGILLGLPGIGPYGAAHVMLTLGRYSKLILDSWTRPTYAKVRGSRRPVSDAAIVRRFRGYGPWAGLAFWCSLTRDWVADRPA